MAFMLGSCQQKLQAEPAKSNNLFSTLLDMDALLHPWRHQ